MKPIFWISSITPLVLSFSSCTNQGAGDDPLGTGPYDAQGNYVEKWADDPTKWSKPGTRSVTPVEDPPVIAKVDQPPANSTPISSAPGTSAPRETTRSTTRPVEVASRTRTGESEIKTTTRHTPKSSSTSSSTKSTPKKTVAKAKPKPKPKSSRYTVKKGDSLSTIAARNGSSVSAIQRANGISGTLIHPGQSLVVPKR